MEAERPSSLPRARELSFGSRPWHATLNVTSEREDLETLERNQLE